MFKIYLFFSLSTLITHTPAGAAGLLIENSPESDNKLLFKSTEPHHLQKNDSQQPRIKVLTTTRRKKINDIKPIEPTKSQKILKEINAEIKSLNKEINLYNTYKVNGNYKEALRILELIRDRRLTIFVLKQEKKHNTKN